MAVQSRRTSACRQLRGAGKKKSTVPMARAKDIPAGRYTSEVKKVSFKKTMAGEDAVEVIYELIAMDGSVRQMREVIPMDSYSFECFSDAMIAAGLPDDADIEEVVGVKETVELVYPEPKGLGHFEKRRPVTATTKQQATKGNRAQDDWLEDEEDDLLDEEA